MFLFRPARWECILRLGQHHEALAGLLVTLIDLFDWLIILPFLVVMFILYLHLVVALLMVFTKHLGFERDDQTWTYALTAGTGLFVLFQFCLSTEALNGHLKQKKAMVEDEKKEKKHN
jgi:hypothetical protein